MGKFYGGRAGADGGLVWRGAFHFAAGAGLDRGGAAAVGGDLQARTDCTKPKGELGQLAEKFDEMAAVSSAARQGARRRGTKTARPRPSANHRGRAGPVRAGRTTILETLFTQGALMTGQMLAVDIRRVFQRLPDGRLLMLAGIGWKPGRCGQTLHSWTNGIRKSGFSAATGEVRRWMTWRRKPSSS